MEFKDLDERSTLIGLLIAGLTKIGITFIRRRRPVQESEKHEQERREWQEQQEQQERRELTMDLYRAKEQAAEARVHAAETKVAVIEEKLNRCEAEKMEAVAQRNEILAKFRAWQKVVAMEIRRMRKEIAQLKGVPYVESDDFDKLMQGDL